jgi:hypothetical protein
MLMAWQRPFAVPGRLLDLLSLQLAGLQPSLERPDFSQSLITLGFEAENLSASSFRNLLPAVSRMKENTTQDSQRRLEMSRDKWG